MTLDLAKLRAPIFPERVRRIGGESFSFIPHRFLRDGFLASIPYDELALYVFLVLAGNRDGISFYRYDAICSILRMTLDDYIAVRDALVAKQLIAFDGTRYQVLSLPGTPVFGSARTTENLQDPASIRAAILASLKTFDR